MKTLKEKSKEDSETIFDKIMSEASIVKIMFILGFVLLVAEMCGMLIIFLSSSNTTEIWHLITPEDVQR